MTDNKQTALDFLNLVTSGKIDEAYEKHVDMNGKHHNLYFAPGFSVMKQGMKDNEKEFPNKTFSVKHVIGEGELVAVHSHVVLKAKELEIAVVHLFRFEKGKIVEMWDCGAQIPADSPNTDGAF